MTIRNLRHKEEQEEEEEEEIVVGGLEDVDLEAAPSSSQFSSGAAEDPSPGSKREEEPDIVIKATVTSSSSSHEEEEGEEFGGAQSSRPPPPSSPTATTSSSSKKYPKPFYCPITKKVMDDPVVNLDGISYERIALMEKEGFNADETTLYTNRALKAVIDETVEAAVQEEQQQLQHQQEDEDNNPSLLSTAGMMKLQDSIRVGLTQVWENLELTEDHNNTSNATINHKPLPEVYYCPITFNLIHDPVIDIDGNTFERVAVENWIRIHGNSPITRTPLQILQLRTNHAIQELLKIETSRPESEIHPHIVKWLEERPPESTDPELGGNILLSANLDSNGRVIDPDVVVLTPEQIQEQQRHAERRRKSRCLCSVVCIFMTLLFYFLFFRFGGFGLLFIGILCCNYACRFSSRENNDNEPNENHTNFATTTVTPNSSSSNSNNNANEQQEQPREPQQRQQSQRRTRRQRGINGW